MKIKKKFRREFYFSGNEKVKEK